MVRNPVTMDAWKRSFHVPSSMRDVLWDDKTQVNGEKMYELCRNNLINSDDSLTSQRALAECEGVVEREEREERMLRK